MLSHKTIEQITPWVVSGASGYYILLRARQLSQAAASEAGWGAFLAQQSDIILVLCGGPALWHTLRRGQIWRGQLRDAEHRRSSLTENVAHQLRQVYTVLLLGLGMIARKAAVGKTAEIAPLARRLQATVRNGARIIDMFELTMTEETWYPHANGRYIPDAPANSA